MQAKHPLRDVHGVPVPSSTELQCEIDEALRRETPDGTLLLNLGQYGRAVEVAAIPRDGQRMLTVREVGVAKIWDPVTGRCVGKIRPDSPMQGTTGTAPMAGASQVFIESAALNHDGSAALRGRLGRMIRDSTTG